MVEYYDPSRTFIKSLIQSLVPNLEEQQQCELNKIHVILYTLNVNILTSLGTLQPTVTLESKI
jgi:hypothetical protein